MKLDWKINAYNFWFASTPHLNFWITPPNENSKTFDLFVGRFGVSYTSYESLEDAQEMALKIYRAE